MTVFIERFGTLKDKGAYPKGVIRIIDREKMIRLAVIELDKEYEEKELNKLAEYICQCIDEAVGTGEIKL